LWIEVAPHHDDFGGLKALGLKARCHQLFGNEARVLWRANTPDRQMRRELPSLWRKAFESEFLFNQGMQSCELIRDRGQSNPEHTRALRRRETPRPANLDLESPAEASGALDGQTHCRDSSRRNVAEELHSQMNMGGIDPAYLRIVCSKYLLQPVYAFFYGLGDFDADECADRGGASRIGLMCRAAGHRLKGATTIRTKTCEDTKCSNRGVRIRGPALGVDAFFTIAGSDAFISPIRKQNTGLYVVAQARVEDVFFQALL
jgi:hypothetical protein